MECDSGSGLENEFSPLPSIQSRRALFLHEVETTPAWGNFDEADITDVRNQVAKPGLKTLYNLGFGKYAVRRIIPIYGPAKDEIWLITGNYARPTPKAHLSTMPTAPRTVPLTISQLDSMLAAGAYFDLNLPAVKAAYPDIQFMPEVSYSRPTEGRSQKTKRTVHFDSQTRRNEHGMHPKPSKSARNGTHLKSKLPPHLSVVGDNRNGTRPTSGESVISGTHPSSKLPLQSDAGANNRHTMNNQVGHGTDSSNANHVQGQYSGAGKSDRHPGYFPRSAARSRSTETTSVTRDKLREITSELERQNSAACSQNANASLHLLNASNDASFDVSFDSTSLGYPQRHPVPKYSQQYSTPQNRSYRNSTSYSFHCSTPQNYPQQYYIHQNRSQRNSVLQNNPHDCSYHQDYSQQYYIAQNYPQYYSNLQNYSQQYCTPQNYSQRNSAPQNYPEQNSASQYCPGQYSTLQNYTPQNFSRQYSNPQNYPHGNYNQTYYTPQNCHNYAAQNHQPKSYPQESYLTSQGNAQYPSDPQTYHHHHYTPQNVPEGDSTPQGDYRHNSAPQTYCRTRYFKLLARGNPQDGLQHFVPLQSARLKSRNRRQNRKNENKRDPQNQSSASVNQDSVNPSTNQDSKPGFKNKFRKWSFDAASIPPGTFVPAASSATVPSRPPPHKSVYKVFLTKAPSNTHGTTDTANGVNGGCRHNGVKQASAVGELQLSASQSSAVDVEDAGSVRSLSTAGSSDSASSSGSSVSSSCATKSGETRFNTGNIHVASFRLSSHTAELIPSSSQNSNSSSSETDESRSSSVHDTGNANSDFSGLASSKTRVEISSCGLSGTSPRKCSSESSTELSCSSSSGTSSTTSYFIHLSSADSVLAAALGEINLSLHDDVFEDAEPTHSASEDANLTHSVSVGDTEDSRLAHVSEDAIMMQYGQRHVYVMDTIQQHAASENGLSTDARLTMSTFRTEAVQAVKSSVMSDVKSRIALAAQPKLNPLVQDTTGTGGCMQKRINTDTPVTNPTDDHTGCLPRSAARSRSRVVTSVAGGMPTIRVVRVSLPSGSDLDVPWAVPVAGNASMMSANTSSSTRPIQTLGQMTFAGTEAVRSEKENVYHEETGALDSAGSEGNVPTDSTELDDPSFLGTLVKKLNKYKSWF